MRTIIAGSRSFNNHELFLSTMEKYQGKISAVLCGLARGADAMGAVYAECECIPLEEYPADWPRYGKRAGHVRNREMAEAADQLIAFWDGVSPGTRNMIELAEYYDLKIEVVKYE